MKNSWIVVKSTTLITWQTKVDLKVASHQQHLDCYILSSNDVDAIRVWKV